MPGHMAWLLNLKARARELKADVIALYLSARHPSTPWYAKLFVFAIVAYALSPIDLIPDFIPVLGLVDEIVLLPFAIMLAIKLIPADVMAECRAQATNKAIGTRAGRVGAIAIGVLWVTLALIAGKWALSA